MTTIEEKTNSDFLRVTSFVCRFIDSMKKEPENEALILCRNPTKKHSGVSKFIWLKCIQLYVTKNANHVSSKRT